MCYQIECRQTFQSPGKRWTKTERMSVRGWTITLATEDEARAIRDILSPSLPYILSQHEFDMPYLNVIEGGGDAKTIAEVITLLGEQDYYNPDGTRKTDAEIYGEEGLFP